MSKSNPVPAMCSNCGTAYEVSASTEVVTALCPRCTEPVAAVEVAQPNEELWDSEFWREVPTGSQEQSTTPQRKTSFSDVIVTTGDIKQDYRIIGPVYFQLSNKGLFQTEFRKYEDRHKKWLESHYSRGQIQEKRGWSGLFGEMAVGANQFSTAFFIAVQELKLRTFNLGGDAIVAMRQDMDIDNIGVQGFYLQMYGTAVKLREAVDQLVPARE